MCKMLLFFQTFILTNCNLTKETHKKLDCIAYFCACKCFYALCRFWGFFVSCVKKFQFTKRNALKILPLATLLGAPVYL